MTRKSRRIVWISAVTAFVTTLAYYWPKHTAATIAGGLVAAVLTVIILPCVIHRDGRGADGRRQ